MVIGWHYYYCLPFARHWRNSEWWFDFFWKLFLFQNLGASVETVVLHTNRLKHLEVETFVALQSLRSLQVSLTVCWMRKQLLMRPKWLAFLLVWFIFSIQPLHISCIVWKSKLSESSLGPHVDEIHHRCYFNTYRHPLYSMSNLSHNISLNLKLISYLILTTRTIELLLD